MRPEVVGQASWPVVARSRQAKPPAPPNTVTAPRGLVGQAFSLPIFCGGLLVLLLSVPAVAAITGTVINRTTGQPQPGATVGLNKLGQNGIELIDQAKSDANGR